MERTSPQPERALAAALGALVLALLGPLAVGLAAEASRRSGHVALVVTPLAALAAISVFAFHVRYARVALDSPRRGVALLAALALVVGVAGFLAAVAVVLGIPAADGSLVPRP